MGSELWVMRETDTSTDDKGRTMKVFQDKNYWALILGGSSGMGLASAKKLASMGMNLFVVHRDRRGAMKKIDQEFEEIRATGVKLHNFNTNALSADGRSEVLGQMADFLDGGHVRVLLHSIAMGNLKLIARQKESQKESTLSLLAHHLEMDASKLQAAVDQLFESGADDLVQIATPPAYNNEMFSGEEDFAATIYNMGTSIVSWAQDLLDRGMFASDARVLGLTSEGNEIAWKGYAAVAAAKTALESVSRAMAVEMAPFGIRSNILQPGVTDTPALRLIPGNLHMKASAKLRNPFGRLTTPEDVANVVGLLSHDDSSWINGSIIRVDGGEHISG